MSARPSCAFVPFCVRARVFVCAYHASGAPDVGRSSVLGSDQNLQGPVLPGLYVLGEVLVLWGGEAQRERRDWLDRPPASR